MTKKYIARVLILLGCVSPLGIDLYIPAIKLMSTELNYPINYLLGTYILGIGISQTTWGILSDRMNRKIVLIIGLVIFVISSLGISFSNNHITLYFLRLFQGVGGGGVITSVFAITRNQFDNKTKDIIYSQISGFMNIIPIISPAIGVFILNISNWRFLFVITAIVGLVFILISIICLPNDTKKLEPAVDISMYKYLLHDKNYILCCVMSGLILGIIFSYINISYKILVYANDFSLTAYTNIFSANAFLMFITGFVAAKVLENIPEK